MLSPLSIAATAFGKALFVRAARAAPLWGVTLHTTGSGILDKSPKKTSAETLQKAVEYYANTGGPHYVIGWDGTAVAIVADENMRGAHAGIQSADQTKYTQGTWRRYMSPAGAALWQKLWPGKSSPIDLIPNRNLNYVNDYWIGIEMIPITYDGKSYFAKPAFGGARFTKAQHEKAKALSDDIAKRHHFPGGWKGTPRLLGHSDLNPIERDSPNFPLWDPGYASGAFDMGYVRGSSSMLIAISLVSAAVGLGVYLGLRASRST